MPFFIGRAVLYFAVWMLCTFLLNKYSAAQERGEAGIDPADTRQARVVAAPGLLVYALTISFAAVDWVMSINAHWYSTIFGMLLMVGQGLTAFAFVIAILALLADDRAAGQLPDLAALPRLRQAAARVRDAVGVPGVLAVPDHLGRQPAGRDPVVPAADPRPVGLRLAAAGVRPVRAAVPAAAVAQPEGASGAAGQGRHRRPDHAADRPDLAGRAELRAVTASRSTGWTSRSRWAWLGVWLFLFVRQLRSRSLLPLNDPFFKKEFAHEAH